MSGNRKAAEDFIIKNIAQIAPGSPNEQMYIDMFKSMSDKQFSEFIHGLKDGKNILPFIIPNMQDYSIDVKRNIDHARKLGHEMFKRIWVVSPESGQKYLTPHKHLVYKLPVRRQAQILVKKVSIPKDNHTVDYLTGQPTGESKGAKISYVELQILNAIGMDKSIEELIKLRGGDTKGFNAMNTLINRNGVVSQKEVEPFTEGVKSTQVLKAYLTSAHLESDL